jgi:hypothetical protein
MTRTLDASRRRGTSASPSPKITATEREEAEMSATPDAGTTADDDLDDLHDLEELEELELLESGTTLAGALNDVAFLLAQSYVRTSLSV